MTKQKLNKDVDKIITKLVRELSNIDGGICDQITGKPMTDYVLNKQNAIDRAISELSNLIPEEGEVIAEGKVIIKNKKDRTINVFLEAVKEWLEYFEDKKIQITIREVKE